MAVKPANLTTDVGLNTTHRGAAAPHQSSWSGTWPTAAADTVLDRLSFPSDSTEVVAIHVAPIGVAGTGTVAINAGIAAGGNTMLNAATYDLSGLSDNTLAAMTLTGTAADLQGDDTDGITVTFVNASVPHLITITFGAQ
jgi:hypothetical protein